MGRRHRSRLPPHTDARWGAAPSLALVDSSRADGVSPRVRWLRRKRGAHRRPSEGPEGREPHVEDAIESAQAFPGLIDQAADADESVTAVGWSQGSTFIVKARRIRPSRITTAVLGSVFLAYGTRPTDAERTGS